MCAWGSFRHVNGICSRDAGLAGFQMMRTQLRTDRAVPISIPNRAITDMIVSNESHIKTPSVSIAVRRPEPALNPKPVLMKALPSCLPCPLASRLGCLSGAWELEA